MATFHSLHGQKLKNPQKRLFCPYMGMILTFVGHFRDSSSLSEKLSTATIISLSSTNDSILSFILRQNIIDMFLHFMTSLSNMRKILHYQSVPKVHELISVKGRVNFFLFEYLYLTQQRIVRVGVLMKIVSELDFPPNHKFIIKFQYLSIKAQKTLELNVQLILEFRQIFNSPQLFIMIKTSAFKLHLSGSGNDI